MEDLNYRHLLYFLRVARTGSLVRASAGLGLAPSTVSTQIRALERSLGGVLFERRNRGVVLTPLGREVLPYVEEIHGLGIDLQDLVEGRAPSRSARLVVGVATALHKVLAPQFLAPIFRLGSPVHLVCREDQPDRLIADLAGQGLDLVLSDAPANPRVHVRASNHLLGESGTTFLASEKLAASLRGRFPRCLDGAPFLLPASHTPLRHALDRWFDAQGIRPRIVGEFEDNAILKAFGEQGLGVFTAPSAIEGEVRRRYRAHQVGEADEVRETFYAITVGRRIQNRFVAAIVEAAKERLVD